MLDQMYAIFLKQFELYGMEAIGYLIMAVCFGLFYFKSIQKFRFQWISRACYIWALGNGLRVLLPPLVVLNPSFQVSQMVSEWSQMVFVCAGLTCLWMSLLIHHFGQKQLYILVCSIFIAQVIELYFLCGLLELSAEMYMLAIAWFIVGISLIRTESAGRTAWFSNLGDILVILALYYVARENNLFVAVQKMPLYIFGGIGLFVLIVQSRFMRVSYEALVEQLEDEKKRRTLFWDIAPFPILVSKLLDDSVLYINPAARQMLHIELSDVPQFHLSDYFAQTEKRGELVEKVRQFKIVEGFEVQMRSPKNGKRLWLNLSARVVELDGELALYLNLHNVTEQKNTEEKLFQEASTDTLTGLYNRRQFEALFNQAIASAVRYKTPYCVMMSDIDHFKNVNDTYGHEAGDVVLKTVASLMKKTFRTSDIVARFGGEEFIVFFTNTDINGAQVAAEHFRQVVERAAIVVDGKQIPITISLGLTGETSTDLLALTKQADLALYYAKEHGRNQVHVYTRDLEEANQ